MNVPTEEQICQAIVAVHKSVPGAGPVHDYFLLPEDGLIENLDELTVDADSKTNVVFVERVNVTTVVNRRHRPIRDIHEYYCWFYFGYKAAGKSGRAFQKRVEDSRLKFREAANEHLGFGLNVHHDGLVVSSQMQITKELGGRHCHRAVMLIKVYVDLDC